MVLEELTSAPPLVQAALYQLTLDRCLGDYELPDGWYVVAAGNRMEDRAVVFRMSTALANRFSHVELEVDVDLWAKWAISHDIDPFVVGFIKWRPDLLFQFHPESSEKSFPTPRTWEFVSQIKSSGLRPTTRQLLIDGTVGHGAATEFDTFLTLQTKLPDLDPILAGTSSFWPKELDLRYAIISGLVARAKPQHYEAMLQYSGGLPSEYSVMLITQLAQRNRSAMATAASWRAWAKKHHEIIPDVD